MTRRRRQQPDTTAQERFAWSDVARVFEEAPAGEVLYEAPPVAPRPRATRTRLPAAGTTLGLPFGVRETDGRTVCWSCGHDVDESRIVRAGPGDVRCAGCGAKLPFH